MTTIFPPKPNVQYTDRLSSYGILKNELGQIAIVEMIGWGLIFPGGAVESGENTEEALKRELLEETGFSVKELTLYKQVDSYYEIDVRGKWYSVHNIADIYIGEIGEKVRDSEEETSLHWFYPEEVKGKLRVDFHNTILEWLQ